ncbi:hypothetical protein CGX12_11785 [Zobellella denitrificans]|uniref:hypothetical protein n=1 Tax=Zobellella denitrificans TaxID=347534 RepID=UPI000B8C0991|nr:hypothetical protein [Zobellella denitrificans]OXS14894.1 hypothetical protein CGX12_11785 [Zobellella denitrificans]
MTTSNIERFDQIVAQVLGDLYTSFPCPATLKATSYIENALAYNDFLGAEVITGDGEFFNNSLGWLAQAGYLRCSQIDAQLGIAGGVVLTAKGLEALRAVPASLEGKCSLGERLATQAKSSGADAIRSLVGEVIGAAVRGATGV